MSNLKIFIFAFNRTDLLQKQIDCLKKYLVGQYDINLVYDYREDNYGDEFESICLRNNIKFHRHNSKPGNNPSGYHGDSIDWVYNNFLEDGDYVMFLDHDMFIINHFDLKTRLSEYDIIGHKQSRGDFVYFWPGLLMFNYSKIKHIPITFVPCVVGTEILDSGGGTYPLYKDKNIKINFFDQEYPDLYKNLNLKEYAVNSGFVFELFDNSTFLHSHNASHWHNNYNVNDENKTKILFMMLDDILSEIYD